MADLTFRVTEHDTAAALGSGDVSVLGTPRLLAWLEAATVAAVADLLAPWETTVGVAVELRHRAPSPIGAEVRVTADVLEVHDSRITLAVQAHNPDDVLAATGQVVRMRVPRSRFP